MRRPVALALIVLLASGACSDGEEQSERTDAGGAAGVDQEASADVANDGDASETSADAGNVWPIISQSAATAFETETHLAAASTGRLLATWIGVTAQGETHIGYALSPDYGDTWQPPASLQAPGDRVAVDPVVAVDDGGTFYLAFIGLLRDTQGAPYDMRVFVAKAAVGESALSPPVDVTGPVASDTVDKTWATTDPTGRLYVTWNDPGAARMRVAVSEDGAKTFAISDVGSNNGYLAYPCLDRSTGRLHVVHHENQATGHQWSDDQGKTWSTTTQVSLLTDEPAVFNDPTCTAHGGEVWVAYGVGTDSYSSSDLSRSNRIRVARSADGGQSYVRFYAEDPSAGTKFLNPQLARADDGHLLLLYYAGTDDNPDPAGSLRLAESSDGGASFAPSQLVHAPITFATARPVAHWLGDYIGLFVGTAARYGTFADNASGKSHIRFFRLP